MDLPETYTREVDIFKVNFLFQIFCENSLSLIFWRNKIPVYQLNVHLKIKNSLPNPNTI